MTTTCYNLFGDPFHGTHDTENPPPPDDGFLIFNDCDGLVGESALYTIVGNYGFFAGFYSERWPDHYQRFHKCGEYLWSRTDKDS